jgi:hypothetical protein
MECLGNPEVWPAIGRSPVCRVSLSQVVENWHEFGRNSNVTGITEKGRRKFGLKGRKSLFSGKNLAAELSS